MREIDLFGEAVRTAIVLASTVRPEQRSLPTPCAEWNVQDLLHHLGFVAALGEYAGARRPWLDQDAFDFVPLAEQLAVVWSVPEAWEGTTVYHHGEMPAQLAGMMTMGDLVLHGWDLACATGQPFSCSSALAEAVESGARSLADQARSMGLFGPAVPVPSGAGPLERALRTSGRDPDMWTPVDGALH